MAEAARRTVVIRGQVVDRYSPRRSTAEIDPRERRSHADGITPGHQARRPMPVRAEGPGHFAGERAERPRRPERYDARRSHSSRRQRGPYDQALARPDRIAMWAVLLGIILLLAAATSSHAAVLAHVVVR
jgi:hypothetical protein